MSACCRAKPRETGTSGSGNKRGSQSTVKLSVRAQFDLMLEEFAGSQVAQERGECVDCQVAGVVGGWRQASDFADQILPTNLAGFA